MLASPKANVDGKDLSQRPSVKNFFFSHCPKIFTNLPCPTDISIIITSIQVSRLVLPLPSTNIDLYSMSPPEFPDQINGFIVAPVILSAQDNKDPSPVYHTIYLKKHQFKRTTAPTDDDEDDEGDRTVFAANLPILTSFENIKKFCNAVADVLVEDFVKDPNIPNAGKIILVDKSAANRFIAKSKTLYKLKDRIFWNATSNNNNNSNTTSADSIRGIDRYTAKTLKKYPPHDQLQRMVDLYMLNFAKAEARELQNVRSLAEQVDEDGFTLVVSSTRKSAADIRAAPKMTEDEAIQNDATSGGKKKKSKEKKDFYRFQIREQKKQEMNSLLKRFKEDQDKIKDLKEKKRFKPY